MYKNDAEREVGNRDFSTKQEEYTRLLPKGGKTTRDGSLIQDSPKRPEKSIPKTASESEMLFRST